MKSVKFWTFVIKRHFAIKRHFVKKLKIEPSLNWNDYSNKISVQVNAPAALLNQVGPSEDNYDPFAETRRDKSIASRENEYRQKRLHRQISPERHDPFADG